jgi:zinc transporter ZupT
MYIYLAAAALIILIERRFSRETLRDIAYTAIVLSAAVFSYYMAVESATILRTESPLLTLSWFAEVPLLSDALQSAAAGAATVMIYVLIDQLRPTAEAKKESKKAAASTAACGVEW